MIAQVLLFFDAKNLFEIRTGSLPMVAGISTSEQSAGSDALPPCSSSRTMVRWRSDIDLLSSTTCVEDAYGSDVYNANDVDLKARSHCGNINEVSCQFIVLLQFTSVAAI